MRRENKEKETNKKETNERWESYEKFYVDFILNSYFLQMYVILTMKTNGKYNKTSM